MVFIAAIVIIALVFGFAYSWSKKKKQQAAQWPMTPGMIVQSQPYWSTDSEGNRVQEAAITYEYAVGGQVFRAKRISFGLTIRQPHVILAKYPLNAQVQVFYDPSKPGDAVLER